MKLFKILPILLLCISGKAQTFNAQMDIGYSTRSINVKPVYALQFGKTFLEDEFYIIPVIQIGLRAHTDQQSNNNVYGHLSAGVQYQNFVSLTIGGIYGGNQQKQDRHIILDSTIMLTPGAESEHYLSYQIALTGMLPVFYCKDGKDVVGSLIAQTTYAHKVFYASLGIRFNLFSK